MTKRAARVPGGVSPHPAMFPEKLYVEITTRCNMRCGMCVKHVPGSRISNRDMAYATYERLADHFPQTRELIVNGIGEPLLHPQLGDMVSLAATRMPADSRRGFQSNGLLMSKEKARELLDAGLNLVCFSVDTDAGGPAGLLHHSRHPDAPFLAMDEARRALGRKDLRLGAEIVIVRETLPQLARLVERLAAAGVDFIIGSHLLAYAGECEASSLFTTATTEALQLYRRHKRLAAKDGVDLAALTGKTWIAPRRREEWLVKNRFRQMIDEAREDDIWLHIPHLEEYDTSLHQEAERYYAQARETARRCGIDLDLPPLVASRERSCRFIDRRTAFVDTDGFVLPCHALWHDYTVYMHGEAKHCHRRAFGNLLHHGLDEIWQDDAFMEFRDHAGAYRYPYCHSCGVGPCPDITGEYGPFINDCFGLPVPCGHCLWCYDAIRCL